LKISARQLRGGSVSNVKVIDRRPFDLNLTMQWNDVQQLITRSKRMWASAEDDYDYVTLELVESCLEILAENIRKRLDKR
jgi:hypothetical protein